MKIIDKLNEKGVCVSCELFPPKQGSQLAGVQTVVKEIAMLKPAFMSVTYGAGGTETNHTIDVANEVQAVNGIPALAHLTCISSSKTEIKTMLDDLKAHNIKNILALRGDMPKDTTFAVKNHYHHASELISEIRAYGDFCIGGACYPEGHPESETVVQDIENLKRKVESGCEFLTTQMFFDNNILYNFMFKLLKAKVDVPVIAGIMPVTNAKQMSRICELSGTKLPQRFKAIVDKFSDNPDAMKQAGIAYATEQIIDLIANDVKNIHIYTMNKPDIAQSIFNNLSEIIK